eukprot:TRINITY_DN707_c0_g1_i3.p1 TRINITY_DN707_c0_g1~~TRINITY_DN707_c0_g1_i3.p1  ORF type:complete len:424 (+),score=54.81 TRINITY_DN707_c0_g1_i3:292-1563(+)
MDIEASETKGMIDVLDILKLFAQLYDTNDDIETVKLKWQKFAQGSIGSVVGLSKRDPMIPLKLDGRLGTAAEIMRNGVHRLAIMNTEFGIEFPYVEFILTQSDVAWYVFSKLRQRIRDLQGEAEAKDPPSMDDEDEPPIAERAASVLPADDMFGKTVEELGLIKSAIVTVTNDRTTLQCFKLMDSLGIGGLPIVDSAGRCIGSLSAADIRGITEEHLQDLLFPPMQFLERMLVRHTPLIVPRVTPYTPPSEQVQHYQPRTKQAKAMSAPTSPIHALRSVPRLQETPIVERLAASPPRSSAFESLSVVVTAGGKLKRPQSPLSVPANSGVKPASNPYPLNPPQDHWFARKKRSNSLMLPRGSVTHSLNLVTCSPSDTFLTILERFFSEETHWIRRMYVVDSQRRPIGVITFTSTIKVLFKCQQM